MKKIYIFILKREKLMIKRSEFIGKIKKPFPWAGSKVKAAPLIMELLHGDKWANQHIEPFVGSNACLMHMPLDGVRVILNDFDGKLTNVWRCLKYKPIELADAVTGITNSIAITGWDLAIQKGYDAMLDRLHADVEYCDVKLGAYYLDLMANWVGDNPGGCKGPWVTIKDEDGYDILVKSTTEGVRGKQAQYMGDRGVSCQQTHYPADRGVACQQTQYSSGQGVACQQTPRESWFSDISERLSNAKILSHDWKKIMNMYNITSKKTAIMFDPPYNTSGNNGGGIEYINADNNTVSGGVRRWIVENIEALKNTRILVCGRGTEHDELLQYGFQKIKSVNVKSLNKKLADESTQEFLWYKRNNEK